MQDCTFARKKEWKNGKTRGIIQKTEWGLRMPVKIECIWEHNGNDTLLYAADFPGAYARGGDLNIAASKMEAEVRAYLAWKGCCEPKDFAVEIVQDSPSDLDIRDADSDVLFPNEEHPLTLEEYTQLKMLALKSAADFHALYESVLDKDCALVPSRKTFYGQVPRTAREMYQHTKNVNAYYFGEIEMDVDNGGTIFECRKRGFDALERNPDFLSNPVIEGSYGEKWTLRKVLRRFLWHDRIHGKAMYRMAVKIFGTDRIPDVFCLKDII
jgi:hypothetical protein